MATGTINNSGLTKKKYSGTGGSVTNNWHYFTKNISTDISTYGEPIGVTAYGQYDNPVVANIESGTLRVMNPVSQSITMVAEVTFSSKGISKVGY